MSVQRVLLPVFAVASTGSSGLLLLLPLTPSVSSPRPCYKVPWVHPFMRVPGIREHLHWRGPWIVFLLSLRELLRPLFYWHIWHIYETDLIREFPQPYSRSILDVVIYTSQDDLSSIKPRLIAMGELSALEVETRFHRGDAVALTSTSGEPVGHMWMAFSSGIELKFDTYWIIHTGEALRYGAFVVPSFRGRGIYSVLNSALNTYALERGVTTTLGSVSVLNRQSLSLPKHYNRRISMTVFLARTRLFSFTLRKSFRAPLHSRFSWPAHPPSTGGATPRTPL